MHLIYVYTLNVNNDGKTCYSQVHLSTPSWYSDLIEIKEADVHLKWTTQLSQRSLFCVKGDWRVINKIGTVAGACANVNGIFLKLT